MFCDRKKEDSYSKTVLKIDDFGQTLFDEFSAKWFHIGSRIVEKQLQFWSIEWRKHETCGKLVPSVNSTKKYFAKAIELSNVYNLTRILGESGIRPGYQGKAVDFNNAIMKITNAPIVMSCHFIPVS